MSQQTALAGAHVCAAQPAFTPAGTSSNRKARLGRRLLAFLSALAIGGAVQAQSSANYTFSTAATGSLTQDMNGNAIDMSTGTTQLVAASSDQGVSSVTNIGFDFWMMGNRFSQYSTTANGIVQLGGTAASGSNYLASAGTATLPIISAFASDSKTGSAGKVHYKLVGSAPNRTMVIEFLNIQLFYTSAGNTGDGTYQVRLYESTGAIELVYGAMNITNVASTSDASPGIGFSAGSTANTFAYVTASSHTASTAGTFTDNPAATVGTYTALNSTLDGSRRYYRFIPSVTPSAAPTGLTFATVGTSSMTLNWTAASPTTGTLKYAVYNSTDNTTFTFVNTVAVGTNTLAVTGLTPNTTYYWKVYSASEGVLSAAAATGTQATAVPGNITSTASGGNWSSASTWVGGSVPSAADTAVIADGATVTIDASAANPTVGKIVVGGGTSGILQYNTTAAQTVTVTKDVIINSGAKFQTGATGSVTTHKLVVGGNLTNNGTLDFSTNSNGAGADLTFNTAGSVSFSGTGIKTNLFTLTMSKSVIGDIVDMSLSNFQVRSLSASATGSLLASSSGTGTLKISGTNTFSGTLWSTTGYTIGSTMGFWLNNSNFTVQGLGGSPTLSGSLRISAGTYNVGTASGNSFSTSSATSFTVDGGTFNLASRFSLSSGTFTLSSGSINVNTAGNTTTTAAFAISTSSLVTISGGAINLVQAGSNASNVDYNVSSTNLSITGGTLNIGTAATLTKFSFVIAGNTPAINIDNTTNNKTATLSAATSAYGSTTVNAGTTLTLNGFQFTERGTTFTNNGTVNGTTASSSLSFLSASTQTLAGAGTFTSGLVALSNQNTGLTISHTNAIATLRVNLFQGTITNSNKLTLGTGAAAAVVVQIGAAAFAGTAGSFDVAPTFNLGTGTYTVLYAQEGTLRTTGFEIPATRSISAATINNTSNVTIAGGGLSIGTLTLTAGKVNTDASNLLTVTGTTTGSISGGSSTAYVNGPLARTLPASLASGSTYVFPVGKSGYNAFELVNPTTGAGNVVVQAEAFDGNAGGTPGAAFSSLSSTRYWQAQILSGSGTFTNTFVRINDTRGTNTGIGSSSTATGTYNLVGGGNATVTSSSILSVAPAVTSLNGFYLMGVLAPPALSNIGITPSATQCASTPRTASITVTPAGAAITSVVLTYTVNGTGSQNVTLSNGGSGNVYTGTIPAVTPTNGTVAWSVTATDGNNLTSTLAGTSYSDDPLKGIEATISASLTTVCAGSPVTLTAGTSSSITAATYTAPTAVTNATSDEDLGNITLTQGATTILNNTSVRNSLTGTIGTATGTVGSFSNFTGFGPYALTAGQSYNFSMTSVQNGSSAFSHAMAIYIDYNRDGDYADAGEQVYTSAATTSGAHTETGSFTVPATANGGVTRMRVIVNEGLISSPTLTVSYGEFEEYLLNISSSNIGGGATATIASYTWSDGSSTSVATNIVNPTTTTTYYVLGTDANGCSTPVSTNGVTVTVNPVPSAPTATNSNQCGTQVPTASVTSTSGLGSPSFRWYAAASGGTALTANYPAATGATITSNTFPATISATITFYVSEISAAGCESSRTPVTVSVVSPDPVSASVDFSTVCPNTAISLSATQTGSNNVYTYSWTASPATGSGIPTGSASGNPASVTPTASGNYTYTVTANESGTGCTTTATVNVTVSPVPAITSVTATPGTACPGGSIQLTGASVVAGAGNVAIGTQSTTSITAGPYRSGAGADMKVQYLFTAAELQAAGLRAGNISSLAFNVTTVGDASLPSFTISMGATAATSLTSTFATPTLTTVLNPVSYTAVSGLNTHTLNTPFNWDGTSNVLVQVCHGTSSGASSSAVSLFTTTGNFTTYTTGTNVCANATTGTATSSRAVITFGQPSIVYTGNYNWSWTGGLTGASVSTTAPANNTGSPTVISYTVTATNPSTGCFSTGSTNVTVNPSPTAPTASNSTQCGYAVPTASVASTTGLATPTFKWYDAATAGNLLQSSTSVTYTTAIGSTTTFYVAEMNAATGCESSRTAVTVTVNQPDAVTASANGPVCLGNAVNLSAAQTGATNTYTYAWTASPTTGSGLPTSVAGAAASVTPTAVGSYTYTVTATDAGAGCATTSQVSVTVNAVPSVTIASASPAALCAGGTVNLTANRQITAGTAAIGAGASTSTTYESPLYHFWGGLKTQYLYRASDLQAAGLTAGNITSLGLNVVANGSSLSGFRINIGTTASNTIGSSSMTSNITSPVQVYAPAGAVSFTANALNTFTFTTPFNWDGTSNIVVQFCWSNVNTGGTSTTVKFDNPGYAACAYYGDDDLSASSICAITSVDGNMNARPKITLGGQLLFDNTAPYTWSWSDGNTTVANAAVTTAIAANSGNTPLQVTYTAKATIAATGCFATLAAAPITVNPLPSAPTASNSAQCGTQVPTASVASTSGLSTPTFVWYGQPTGGSALQTSTSTTYITAIGATTTFYVSERNLSTGCEGSRTPVTVTVTTPDAVTASSNSPVCAGAALSLSASQTGSTNVYTYSWTASPATGSGIPTGSASGNPASVTPTAAGTYSYTVTATEASTGCVAVSSTSVTVNANPVISTITAAPTNVCPGANVALSASSIAIAASTAAIGTQSTTSITAGPYRSGAGADMKVQYLFTAAELQAAGLRAGNITSLAFNVTTVGDASLPSFTISMGATAATSLTTTFATPTLTTVLNPVNYTAVSGLNTHTLNTPFNWDGTSNVLVQVCHGTSSGASSSAVSLFTTTGNFTTYTTGTSVCASATTGTATSSRAVITFGGQVQSTFTNNYTWTWNPGNLSGASVTAVAQATPGTQTFTVTALNAATGCSSSATVDVSVGATLTAAAAATPGSICLGSSTTLNATPTGGGAPYTYSWTDQNNTVLSTAASFSASPTVNTTYTVAITDACGTTATANTTVTIKALPTVSITPSGTNNLCASSQLLTSSTPASSPTYQWLQSGSPISGATAATYTATAGGSYTVSVTDGSTGCTGTSAATTLNFQLVPSATVVTPATAATICLGSAQTLTASATVPNVVLNENFNSGALGWSTVNASSVGTVNWYNQSAPYTDAAGSATFQNFSVDGSTFAYSNSDIGGSGSTTNTKLVSPSFSTVGFASASLTFQHIYRLWSSDNTIAVEYSTDGTNWTSLKTYTASQGTTTNNAQVAANESITLPAGALNQPSLRIRFNYITTWGYFWIIDNVKVTGAATIQYAWASTAGSGLSVGQQTASASNNSISVTPSVAGIYTYTATTSVSGSTCTSSNTVNVTVIAPSVAPSVLNASVTGSTCPGTNVILTQTGGSLGQGAYWQWYSDAAFTQTVGGQLSSANAQLTVSPSATTSYYLRAEGGTAPCATNVAASNPVTITVYTASVGGTLASAQSFCSGGTPANLTLTGSNGTIQWQSATDAAFTQNVVNYGSNTATLTGAEIGALTASRYVRAVVTNGAGCSSANSNTILLTVNGYPNTFNVQGTATYCDGIGSVVSLSGSESGVSYQLKKNGSNQGSPVAGTGAALSFGVQPAGTYTVMATNAAGCSIAMTGSAVLNAVGPFTAQISAQNSILCSSGNFTTIYITNGPANGNVTVTTNGVNPQNYVLNGSGSFSFQTAVLDSNTTYTITGVSNGSCTTATNVTTTVYVGALVANALPGQSVCAGSTVPPITFQGNFPAGTTYSWTSTNPAIGLAQASGSGSALPSFTATNSGSSIIYSDIAVTPNLDIEGCEVRAMVFRISVKPTPTMSSVGNQSLCAGAQTTAINFSGNMPGTTYLWSNSNPAIGLTAQGAGNIAAFTATNNTNQASITGTLTVTPFFNGCGGTPTSFTITVNKAAATIVYPNSPYCPVGVGTPQIVGTRGGTFSAPAGIVFYSTSTGEINLGGSQAGTYTVTYTVSGAGGGCGGTSTASITILPRATVNTIGNQALCANSATNMVQPTGSATGFTWVNLNPTIGLPASGTGAIPSFTAINNTTGVVTAQINVTPVGDGANSCAGNPVAYRYTIYPRPTVNPVNGGNPYIYCRGTLTTPVTFTSPTANTSFAWTNNNTTVGLGSRGTGGVPSFTSANPLVGATNTATITVTPSANKCAGPTYSFVIDVADCITQSGDQSGDNGMARMAAQVVVGPNPTTNRATVYYKGTDAGPFSVQLLTQQGQAITRPVVFVGSNYTLDLTGLTPGVYVLQLVNTRTKATVQKQVVKL